MNADQITELIVSAIAGLALVGAAAVGLIVKHKSGGPKSPEEVNHENQIYAETRTPASPGGDSAGLLSMSRTLTEMGDKYQELETKFTDLVSRYERLENKLTLLEHSYPLLYGWAVEHTDNWEEIRLQKRPRPLPRGVYHPDFINQRRS